MAKRTQGRGIGEEGNHEHGAWVKTGFDQIAHELKEHAEVLYAAR